VGKEIVLLMAILLFILNTVNTVSINENKVTLLSINRMQFFFVIICFQK